MSCEITTAGPSHVEALRAHSTRTQELEEAIANLVSWYDPSKHHGCQVPEVCREGMRHRVMGLITQVSDQRVREFSETLKGYFGTNDPALRNEPWLTKEVGSEIDHTLADYLSHKEAGDE